MKFKEGIMTKDLLNLLVFIFKINFPKITIENYSLFRRLVEPHWNDVYPSNKFSIKKLVSKETD